MSNSNKQANSGPINAINAATDCCHNYYTTIEQLLFTAER